jgi:hypothetical protein
MTSFTLDTNCVYAIAKGEPETQWVRVLVNAHARGKANVAIGAISASENQRCAETFTNYGDFRALLTALRLDHLETLAPLARSGMGFWDLSLWAGNEMVVLERQIHEVLFPHLEFEVTDYRRRRGLEAGPILPPEWRNARCDVLAL